jgi:preprotein translocase subunit SecE
MSWFSKVKEFFKEVRSEWNKVSFPTRQEVVGTTVVVLVASFIMAIYLAIADQIILRAYQFVIRIFG